jgi:hypothetical protein
MPRSLREVCSFVHVWSAAGLEILDSVPGAGERHQPPAPLVSRGQIEFIAKGWAPQADRARQRLGWQPLPRPQGLQRYLSVRPGAATTSS